MTVSTTTSSFNYRNTVIFVLCLTLMITLFFYRKPQIFLYPKESTQIVRGPCFGRVMKSKYEPHNDTWYVAVFLSPLDIHWQLNPVSGKIIKMEYDDIGNFKLAYKMNKSDENEKCITTYQVRGSKRTIDMYQIAGIAARRIRTYVAVKENFEKGQIMGLILLGSRVDLIISDGKNFICQVRKNDRINGSQTIIGQWKN